LFTTFFYIATAPHWTPNTYLCMEWDLSRLLDSDVRTLLADISLSICCFYPHSQLSATLSRTILVTLEPVRLYRRLAVPTRHPTPFHLASCYDRTTVAFCLVCASDFHLYQFKPTFYLIVPFSFRVGVSVRQRVLLYILYTSLSTMAKARGKRGKHLDSD
jgi:hypothetical protein